VSEHNAANVTASISPSLELLQNQAAVLDRAGIVISVSPGWALSADAGDTLCMPRTPLGGNYLSACEEAARSGADYAIQAHEALRSVLNGTTPRAALTYPCGSPARPLWYQMRVTALFDTGGIAGAAVSHHDITERRQGDLWERWIARVIGEVGSGSCLTDMTGRILYVDSGWGAMHGFTVREMLGRQAHMFYTPELIEKEVQPFIERVLDQGRYRGELQNCHRNGTLFSTETTTVLVRDDQGTPVGLMAVARDISDRKRAEEALRHSEERFRALVQNGSDIILVLGTDGDVRYISPSVQRVLGYGSEQYTGMTLTVDTIVHQEDAAQVATALGAAMRTAGDHSLVEFRARHADGSWRHLEAVATNLTDVPAVGGVVINARDVTERKALEAELRRRAFHDSLTDLPNRALFLDRLGHALERLSRSPSTIAVLFIDLDGFKLVNDSLGHGAGDRLLTTIGARLTSGLRPADTVARFGGDEFAVLIEDAGTASQVLKIASRLIEIVSVPVRVEGRDVAVTASIGITLTESAARSTDNLLREADIALYQAKGLGKARAVLFDDGMDQGVQERLDLETDLRQALERQEFRLFYQPEVDLDTGEIVGVEALLRWQHPVRGLVPPDAFIPLAEETELIVPIGEWVLEEACRQAVEWQALGGTLSTLMMSVNISARQFARRDLAEQVGEALGRSGLAPECLRLEITESAVMQDLDLAVANLDACKDLGVLLALDDFGTGYSSLNYLLRFPVDVLKIDRSFVQRLSEERGAAAVVRAVTATAQALGLDVTVEGIETPRQLGQLREMECTRGQGYYFARPLPADALAALLAGGPIRPDVANAAVAS
jgi:diguanylate cyclase (GGDEF)-like protein/PAS domain S-box-containing protein